jgi:SSS family solute:Na+ symporter
MRLPVSRAVGDVFANEPICVGPASGLVFFVGSLLNKSTASDVMAEWDRRKLGAGAG